MTRILTLITAACVVAASSVVATAESPLTFTAGKFFITTLDGSRRLSDTFGPARPIDSLRPDDIVRLETDEIMKLSLVLPVNGTGDSTPLKAALPEQVVLQIFNIAEPEKIVGFRTTTDKETGKVSWTQRVDRLPVALAAETTMYTFRLLMGSSQVDQSLSLDLGNFEIVHLVKHAGSGRKPSPKEEAAKNLGFYPWEAKRHTFRKEVTEGMPGRTKSIVVALVVVVVPWLVLSGLLSTLLPSLEFKSNLPKLSTSLLFTSLFFLETLGYRYYRGDFVLFTMLPWFFVGAAVGTVAILAGAVKGVGLK